MKEKKHFKFRVYKKYEDTIDLFLFQNKEIKINDSNLIVDFSEISENVKVPSGAGKYLTISGKIISESITDVFGLIKKLYHSPDYVKLTRFNDLEKAMYKVLWGENCCSFETDNYKFTNSHSSYLYDFSLHKSLTKILKS